ncbi:uncharacterized protein LOC143869967 [Tasmannia lanceolata]|uniref:uncharacterized protein LOC143869967 n=1 Tax=Tasmannia lanceolata TaxID=3420 RepID=UPI004063E5F2
MSSLALACIHPWILDVTGRRYAAIGSIKRLSLLDGNPDPDWLKLNFDGANLGNPGPAGIGGVLRDENGVTKWAFSGPIGIENSNEAKIKAILHGIRLMEGRDLDRLIVEGDSLNVIIWLDGKVSSPMEIFSIYG